MDRPVIGITTSCGPDPNDRWPTERLYVNRLYADCVLAAGGAPVLLTKQTPVEVALAIVDGLLIPGGDDLDAAQFGQTNHPTVTLEDPERFLYERRLLQAWPREAPVLGICYGCQAINVVYGGDVLQHIPDRSALVHTDGVMQEYAVEKDSRLATILGTDRPAGRSFHHQANDNIGEGLRAVARAEDGTVEAVESLDERWLFGVQWHPERTPDDPATRRLFESLVAAAAEFRRRRGS
jgi:gamma-glutamyl-gamma-aminobutyrate hydrolase PuuD